MNKDGGVEAMRWLLHVSSPDKGCLVLDFVALRPSTVVVEQVRMEALMLRPCDAVSRQFSEL